MTRQIFNKTISIDGVDIFYREAGNSKNPSLLLLHGFPTSSVMFKNLMVALSDKYHLIAPDYPGFGFSAFPPITDFEYSF
ncbi:MAG TPA: alpha/beta fold hydrolase, partial [Chryseolinea sp.]|nr:alpha/beta fold hydrolase [Chryseolinea sp.]